VSRVIGVVCAFWLAPVLLIMYFALKIEHRGGATTQKSRSGRLKWNLGHGKVSFVIRTVQGTDLPWVLQVASGRHLFDWRAAVRELWHVYGDALLRGLRRLRDLW
jgi:hypothetical protein